MSETNCSDCSSEFGWTTWRYRCFRCGEAFCGNHLRQIPQAEAMRRFGPHRSLHPDGEGVCQSCDRQRVTAVKDGLRDAIVEGETISIDLTVDDPAILAAAEFRVSAILQSKETSYAVLVPCSPWDSSLWLLEFRDGCGVALVKPHDMAEKWGQILGPHLEVPVVHGLLSESELARLAAKLGEAALEWRRSRWLASDLDHRIAWLQTVALRGPLELGPAGLAQATAELARGLLEPSEDSNTEAIAAAAGGVAALGIARAIGMSALRTAVPLLGLATLVASGVMWWIQEEPPVANLLKAAKRISQLSSADEARAALAAAAIDLGRANGKGADQPGVRQHLAALALLLQWLAENRRGALIDAADAAEPLPLAVCLASVGHGDTEVLQRFLASCRGQAAEFPWDRLVQRLADLQTDKGHWTRQPLGSLRLAERLSSGAAKEIWTLADRADVVVAVQLQGQAPAVRREVDLLLALRDKIGQAGSLLGLLQIERAGYLERDGRRRMAYVMPRLRAEPPHQDWPAAKVAVQAGLTVAQTLNHLHRLGYVHGDIKPANILWDAQGRAVLVDYGGAIKLMSDGTAAAYVSSVGFEAPEITGEGRVQAASDIYSLGRTLAVWLAEAPDAPARHDGARHHRELLDTVEEAQRKDPRARPDLAALTAVLQRWLVLQDQPKSRMAAMEQRERSLLERTTARWRQRPSPAVREALHRVVRAQLLPPQGDGVRQRRAVAELWVGLATEITCSELWWPWAARVGQSSMAPAVLANLSEHLGRHPDLALLRQRIDGQSVEFRPQLGQTAQLLRSADYRPVQGAVIVWRQAVNSEPTLDRLVKLAQRLADLRNRLVHGSQGPCSYGSVQDGELTLAESDLYNIANDVVDLGAELLGKPG